MHPFDRRDGHTYIHTPQDETYIYIQRKIRGHQSFIHQTSYSDESTYISFMPQPLALKNKELIMKI